MLEYHGERSLANVRRQSRTSALTARKAPSQGYRPSDGEDHEVTTFKIPPDKTEADITIRELIDEAFERDKSHPRQHLPLLDAESRGKYVLHRT
jgi:hypothetical protein